MNFENLSDEQLELMEAVACGDRAVDDPVVVARRDSDPQFAAWLVEWSETVGALDAAASMEREVLAQAEVAPHEAKPGPKPSPRPGARAVWLLAAVLLLSCAWWFWPPASSGPTPPRRLGGDLAIVVDEAGVFTFDQQLEDGAYFTIEVTEPGSVDAVDGVETWTEPSWSPDRRAWPAVVVVRVIAHNGSGDIIKEGWIRVP